MLECGLIQDHVARRLSMASSTIVGLVQWVRVTGRTADRPRSGAPRVKSVRQDDFYLPTHLCDRFLIAESTSRLVMGNQGVPIHRCTVRNPLIAHGIGRHRPLCGPVLSAHHRWRRLQWVRNHCRQCRRMLCFLTNLSFNLSNAYGCLWVHRWHNESYSDNYVLDYDSFGGGGIMVLGSHKPSFEVSGNTSIKFCSPHQGLVFQHDNARSHVACITRDFLQNSQLTLSLTISFRLFLT